MKLLLFDTLFRKKLFPITSTRAVADILIGIVTIRERWERVTGMASDILTADHLQPLYGEVVTGEYVLVDASVIPSGEVVKQVKTLNVGEALADENGIIAGRKRLDIIPRYGENLTALFTKVTKLDRVRRLEMPCQVFQMNEEMIIEDFRYVSKGRISNNNVETVNITKAANVFIEESAVVDFSNLNASTGPIYIGKNARVMEGCLIRGPFSLGEGAVLKMGAKIYGATAIGPYCVAGGEIKNSVIMGYSNKAHDGYLGDSVIGEWCNLGAGTSNSNMKNNVGEVKVWNYFQNEYIASGTKCGLVMGDYSRSSINTSFNTGTVVGVCCNVFGEGLTPKLIPDFTWGTKGLSRYEFDKALQDISKWKSLKNKELGQDKINVLKHIFEQGKVTD